LEVADILRRYGGDYLAASGGALSSSQRRAIQDILRCRTPALGGHVFQCTQCGHQQYAYHSCRNRNCPKCHGKDTADWLTQRRNELLPVPYFHVVFTLPPGLRAVVRRFQKPLYALLMKAAAEALLKLAADPHYVGGLIGIMAVLHTWTRTLTYHPHVHCLVPAGGVSPDREWRPARKNYLVPVKALSKLFRGIFRDLLKKRMPHLPVPPSVWTTEWVVYSKPSAQGVDTVLNYLGRYVHRVAISNSRILAIEGGQVSFRYQQCGHTEWKTLTLTATEFIRRFLQHVLPAGLHKVRYYGLWAPSNRRLLRQVQMVLAPDEAEATPSDPSNGTVESASSPDAGTPCPRCGEGKLVCTGRLPRQGRAPP
jgi:hypothetical protein